MEVKDIKTEVYEESAEMSGMSRVRRDVRDVKDVNIQEGCQGSQGCQELERLAGMARYAGFKARADFFLPFRQKRANYAFFTIPSSVWRNLNTFFWLHTCGVH